MGRVAWKHIIGKPKNAFFEFWSLFIEKVLKYQSQSKSAKKKGPRRVQVYTNNVDFLSLVRTNLHWIVLFNPGMMSEFHSWWSEQTSVPTIYFLQILRCTLTSYIPTHRQDLHSKSKSQTKNIRTTWNSIDPNGYSMGSKSNLQTSWNSSNNTRRCMLWGRRKQEENLRLHVETNKIWFHILYQCCTIHLN